MTLPTLYVGVSVGDAFEPLEFQRKKSWGTSTQTLVPAHTPEVGWLG